MTEKGGVLPTQGFNSRLREEATFPACRGQRFAPGFNSRLREEATLLHDIFIELAMSVSTHASVRRRQAQ